MARTVSLTPGKRVLFLTKDFELIRKQLRGELDLTMDEVEPADLLDDGLRVVLQGPFVVLLLLGQKSLVSADHGIVDVVAAGQAADSDGTSSARPCLGDSCLARYSAAAALRDSMAQPRA